MCKQAVKMYKKVKNHDFLVQFCVAYWDGNDFDIGADRAYNVGGVEH